MGKSYDIQWQPGFVILNDKHKIIFNKWGAHGTLEDDLRSVIEDELANQIE